MIHGVCGTRNDCGCWFGCGFSHGNRVEFILRRHLFGGNRLLSAILSGRFEEGEVCAERCSWQWRGGPFNFGGCHSEGDTGGSTLWIHP